MPAESGMMVTCEFQSSPASAAATSAPAWAIVSGERTTWRPSKIIGEIFTLLLIKLTSGGLSELAAQHKLNRRIVVVQFEVARASCAWFHGRDARATFSNCTTT